MEMERLKQTIAVQSENQKRPGGSGMHQTLSYHLDLGFICGRRHKSGERGGRTHCTMY